MVGENKERICNSCNEPVISIPLNQYKRYSRKKSEMIKESNERLFRLEKIWTKSWDQKMKEIEKLIIEGFHPYFNKFFKEDDIKDIFNQYKGPSK